MVVRCETGRDMMTKVEGLRSLMAHKIEDSTSLSSIRRRSLRESHHDTVSRRHGRGCRSVQYAGVMALDVSPTTNSSCAMVLLGLRSYVVGQAASPVEELRCGMQACRRG